MDAYNTQNPSSGGCISVPGFRTLQTVHGIFGDAHARLIRLVRRGKKQYAEAVVSDLEKRWGGAGDSQQFSFDSFQNGLMAARQADAFVKLVPTIADPLAQLDAVQKLQDSSALLQIPFEGEFGIVDERQLFDQ